MNLVALLIASQLVAVHASQSPPLSDAIQRTDPKRYRLQIFGDIRVRRVVEENPDPACMVATPLIVPFAKDGAYHFIDPPEPGQYLIVLYRQKKEVPKNFEFIPMDSLESSAARIELPMAINERIKFIVQQFETCYNAEVDEKALAALPWPDVWPTDALAALQPQMYIEHSDSRIVDQMNAWTGGEPKRVTPFMLGKELARHVTTRFQVSGLGVWSVDEGIHNGIRITGAVAALEARRGSIHDEVCLFVAVCRAAGLPARPVIGVNVNSRIREIISWAEFYVPGAGWVTVDFEQLNSQSGPMRQINQSWDGLGDDDTLNQRLPLAYTYHPPVNFAGSKPVERPLLWSWTACPDTFDIIQLMDIDIDRAAFAPNPEP